MAHELFRQNEMEISETMESNQSCLKKGLSNQPSGLQQQLSSQCDILYQDFIENQNFHSLILYKEYFKALSVESLKTRQQIYSKFIDDLVTNENYSLHDPMEEFLGKLPSDASTKRQDIAKQTNQKDQVLTEKEDNIKMNITASESKKGEFLTARQMAEQDPKYKSTIQKEPKYPSRPIQQTSTSTQMKSKFETPYKKAEQETKQEETDPKLKGLDPKLVDLIKNEIRDAGGRVEWDDIAGLEHPKSIIKEIVVWPMLRPDIFTGLRGPPKGILLFGPPGTGKTLIGKCIASQSNATFFSISASSLTSKWVGEGEKMVRTLFAVARSCQPSVIFIDEIDSLLTSRSDNEAEASRKIKTEFLVQFDGVTTEKNERILVIGATNRPHEIDEAARRRLVKRLYIPLPDPESRISIVKRLLSNQHCDLTVDDYDFIKVQTDGYSGSDMDSLCREAAIGPIRSIVDISKAQVSDVRPINIQDFRNALNQVRASVSDKDLESYLEWNKTYGCL